MSSDPANAKCAGSIENKEKIVLPKNKKSNIIIVEYILTYPASILVFFLMLSIIGNDPMISMTANSVNVADNIFNKFIRQKNLVVI